MPKSNFKIILKENMRNISQNRILNDFNTVFINQANRIKLGGSIQLYFLRSQIKADRRRLQI